MATIQPFQALRPQPELAAQICELPYDVMSSDEARQMAEGNPLSFLHVSKPEIDLPPGADLYSPAVYAKGRENFQQLIARGALKQDAAPAFYLYRQIMGGHAQVGLVAAASCAEYLGGIIKKQKSGDIGRSSVQRTNDRLEAIRPTIQAWEDFCEKRDEDPADTALAWLLHQPAVTAPIIGPRTLAQLDGSLRSLAITLDSAALAELDVLFPGPGGKAPEAYAW